VRWSRKLLDRAGNGLPDTVLIGRYVGIAETKNVVAGAPQKRCSGLVMQHCCIGAVGLTVQFNDQLGVMAGEVGNVLPDRDLSPEFGALHSPED
jgi:hypothetical protein